MNFIETIVARVEKVIVSTIKGRNDIQNILADCFEELTKTPTSDTTVLNRVRELLYSVGSLDIKKLDQWIEDSSDNSIEVVSKGTATVYKAIGSVKYKECGRFWFVQRPKVESVRADKTEAEIVEKAIAMLKKVKQPSPALTLLLNAGTAYARNVIIAELEAEAQERAKAEAEVKAPKLSAVV